MPNDDFDIDDDLDDNDEGSSANPLRKQLRKTERELKEAREAAAKVSTMERENAFLKAGIDPDDAKFKYFAKGYDGPLEVDAIRSELVEAGLMAQQGPDPALVEATRAAQVSAGADQMGTPETRVQEGLAAIAAATSQEEVLRVAEQYGVRIKSPLDD